MGKASEPRILSMSGRALKILIGFSFCLFLYAVALPLLVPWLRVPRIPGGTNSGRLVVILFCLSHAVHALGLRHALVFFGLAATVSWALENAGVDSGKIYGAYHYTDVLGPRIGHVPVVILFLVV